MTSDEDVAIKFIVRWIHVKSERSDGVEQNKYELPCIFLVHVEVEIVESATAELSRLHNLKELPM